VRRIRCARHKLLSDALGNPHSDWRENGPEKLSALGSPLPPHAPEVPLQPRVKDVTSTPETPEKFAVILAQESKRLLAWDRYERRALFRRKLTMRAFDAARCAGV
jgi:hypothetical protein